MFTFGRRENVPAFQWVHDLRWKETPLAAGTNEERGGANRFEAIFTTGSAAMHVGTTAGLGTWKSRAQTDWDVAPCRWGRAGGASKRPWTATPSPPAPGRRTPPGWPFRRSPTGTSNKLLAETTFLCPGRKSQFGAWVATSPDRSLRRALPTDATRPSPDALWPRAADVSQVVNAQLARYFDENAISVQDLLRQLTAGVAGVAGPGAVR